MDLSRRKEEFPSTEHLLRTVTAAVEETTGRGPGAKASPIAPDALLGADLGLGSLTVARLAGNLQKRCRRGPLPFHTLFIQPDGTTLRDIRVSDLVAFLEQHLRATER
jgi:hypothetical protein